eukprot:CAMPEP_0198145630 /NCGR_PEP_ID=MMETSP1443-20131203/24736_1 /TAXON_ID=186043 /ORGANISM="Entomoneis sp., Strain CCMP2396" /LENGTH=551 /DNA_ID=CAMNT_0043809327 /DNA_START=34 /DNA_END=1686 /DNA_ORIENTATION=+
MLSHRTQRLSHVFSTALVIVLLVDTVACHSGDGGNDPFSAKPPSDQAVVQSFTFELTTSDADDDESAHFELGSDSLLLQPPRNSKASFPPWSAGSTNNRPFRPSYNLADVSSPSSKNTERPFEDFAVEGGAEDDQQQSDEYFAVVSSETICNQVPGYSSEWESSRDSFLASWRDLMFEKMDDESDDDDDDDSNNDGSCSILSNAAVYQSDKAREARAQTRQSDDGVPAEANTQQDGQTSRRRRRQKTNGASWRISNRHPAVFSRPASSPSLNTLLKVRGGATPGAAPIQFGSEVAKRLLVSALVTVIFEACIGHVLEFIKIDMQTSTEETYTYHDSIRSITSEKGIGGLWDGFVPWGLIQSICKGSVFGMAQTVASQVLIPMAEGNDAILPMKLAKTLAGGIAGGFQGYILSPTLLLKTRVMTDPIFRENMTMLKTLCMSATIGYNVVVKEGLTSLMKGSNVFATKRVFDWSTRYFFAEWFEAIFAASLTTEGQSLTFLQKSIASFLGGVVSTIFTLPLDVLVSKIQDAKKAGVQVSAIALFKQELKEKGW